MYLDLHTHSHFSDGELPMEEMIREAIKQNVSVLSITDHNFLQNTAGIKMHAKKNKIQYIDGIEISTMYRMPECNLSLHILGYGGNLNQKVLNSGLQKTIDGYNHRAIMIIDKINTLFSNLKLDFQSLKLTGHEAYVSRNTIARIVVQHLAKTISIKEALKQYVFIENEDNTWMISPEESFQLITSARGVPVLAHSGRELRKLGQEAYEKMLINFVKNGLLGLEVYYPKHSEDEVKILRSLAMKFGLYITGGSDWHGTTYTPEISMGIETPVEEINSFLQDQKINLDENVNNA